MAASSSIKFHKPHVLVVEGKDDFWLCVQLLDDLGVDTVQVIDIGGFENLGDTLKLYTKTPGWSSVRRVAVMVDSDGDPAARALSVRSSMKKAGLADPVEPSKFAGKDPSAAFFLVPPHGGCLEDLIRAALKDGSPVELCVDQFVECCGVDDDPPSKRPKTWVHAYIAAKKPGLKIGEAARAGLLRLEVASYEPLRALLLSLQADGEPEAA